MNFETRMTLKSAMVSLFHEKSSPRRSMRMVRHGLTGCLWVKSECHLG